MRPKLCKGSFNQVAMIVFIDESGTFAHSGADTIFYSWSAT
jgi:hypothetical protein